MQKETTFQPNSKMFLFLFLQCMIIGQGEKLERGELLSSRILFLHRTALKKFKKVGGSQLAVYEGIFFIHQLKLIFKH